MSDDPPEKPAARSARGAAVVLSLIVLVAIAVRFHGITADCLWFDEIWHLMLSSGNDSAAFKIPVDTYIESLPNFARHKEPISGVWRGMEHVLHPPLYHLALRAWRLFVDDSPFALRAFSACCSTLAVLLMFDCGRQIASRTAGLLAAALLAVAPSQIEQAQQVRNYSLAILLTSIGLSLALRAPRSSHRLLLTISIAGVTLALMLTHYFAVGICAALSVYVIFSLRGKARLFAAGMLLIAALIFLTTWGSFLREQFAAVEETTDFLNDTSSAPAAHTLTRAAAAPSTLLAGTPANPLTATIGLLLLALPIAATWTERRLWLPILAVLFTVGGLALLDLSRGTQHLAFARHFVVASPAMVLALVCAIEQLRNLRLRRSLQLLAILIAASLLPVIANAPTNPDFRPLVEFVSSRAAPAEPIVFLSPNPAGRDGQAVYLYFAFYTDLFPRPAAVITRSVDGELAAALSRANSIWVVSSGPGIDPQRVWQGAGVIDASSFDGVGSCVRLAPPVK